MTKPGSYCSSGCAKFTEQHMEKVFMIAALQTGPATITPPMRDLIGALVKFYAPFVEIYGDSLFNMCPIKLMHVNQMVSEMSFPVILSGVFNILNVNNAARELLGVSQNDVTKMLIFELIHPDDLMIFMKSSVDCIVNFRELQRVKVRLLCSGGTKWCECVVSETVHKNPDGVPMFSSLAIMRIDDL